MGGGDLNLKKSWHPSTMRNMEKVWKAEQKHDQEKKRIAELQREIQAEKAREDMKKYAEDQGVIEKKSGDVKLDWMYKGPSTAVDHEEYLLGKAIDKSFELQRSQQQNSTAICVPGRTDTCLPGSIFAGTGEQVDVARKLQEDPLLAIRKKELESRSQILKNPVKLKQLKEMIKKQKSKKSHGKHKKDKKKKSKKRSKQSSSSDDSDSDLDAKLLAKYQKLKQKLGDNPLAVLQKSPSVSGNEDKKKHRKRSKTLLESDSEEKKKHKRRTKSSSESDCEDKRKRGKRNQNSSETESDEDEQHKKSRKSYGLLLPHGSKVQKISSSKPPPAQPKDTDKPKADTYQKLPVQYRQKLSDEEKERRRQEMLVNAAWREQEREGNVARYREADKRSEKTQLKGEFGDFMRKQLSQAASESSVASRIKSNINNIQRSGGSMDRNFARR